MFSADTIAALATAPAIAARAIVRISGPAAHSLARALTASASLEHATAAPVTLDLDLGAPIPATVYAFLAPRSSTGEDVVEVHLPGSPFLIARLLAHLAAAGARQAEPGEFTARAFFHRKLTLAAAEGVAATIGASNRAELDAARSLLSGELAQRLTPILDDLVGLLASLETEVDFVDEDVSLLSDDDIREQLDSILAMLQRLLDASPRIERLAHEPRLVLVGRPNAGKSTLLNALAGETRAVISATAGTTRDALSAHIALPGGTVTLIDIAGLDDVIDAATAGDIDSQMSAAAHHAIAQADRVIYVRASDDDAAPIDVRRPIDLVIQSKSDRPTTTCIDGLRVSAITGDGLHELRLALDEIAFPPTTDESSSHLALNGRHVGELGRAVESLRAAHAAVGHGVELIAGETRTAVNHLGRVLGTISPDDVLGRIFSSFCIGK